MKKLLPLILAPTLIAAVCAAILAFVNTKTAPLIAEAQANAAAVAARDVLPQDLPAPVPATIDGIECFVSTNAAGQLQGASIKGVTMKGYDGEINLMVGFTADGTVNTYKVLKSTETPGLGTKIDSDKFRDPLNNRAIDANWTLKKDGGEIDAITSATISSRAALDAIQDAIGKFKTISAAFRPAE